MDSGKTAAGNTAAVREALELAAQALPFTVLTHIGGMPIGDVIDKVDAALAEPPRNCDVGTPEEQSKRYEAYCAEFGRHSNGSPKCIGCPLETRAMKIGGMCELAWAQMPYGKEGDEG